jgi:hypothetical protein
LENNLTFMGAHPNWANACVGSNGNPQTIEYAEGFANAANLLIDRVILDRGIKLHVDVFIYPICFNMRHSVELFLKAAIDQLETLCKYRTPLPFFDGAGSHDLTKLWAFVKLHSVSMDRRYFELIEALDPYITDIASIDSNGQVFRYPYSTENDKHLTELAVINVIVLRARFSKLQLLLQSLSRLGDELLSEYSWGTFTSKLSREELLEIALRLPARQDWATENFALARKSAMQEWNLSSNDFARAARLIQGNYEMSQLISEEMPLQHVKDQLIFDFFDFWVKLHDLEKIKNPPPPKIAEFDRENLFGDMQKDRRICDECWERLAVYLTAESLGELDALYYFARELRYSETFAQLRMLTGQEMARDQDITRPDSKRRLWHLLNKPNALQNILDSLNFLGQHSLIKQMVGRYELQEFLHPLLANSIPRTWLQRRKPFFPLG